MFLLKKKKNISLILKHCLTDFPFFFFPQTKLPFKYDIERIIDDWILMGFLVGNDFIPHLPHMHIHHECLPQLWSAYKQLLPTMDGQSKQILKTPFHSHFRLLTRQRSPQSASLRKICASRRCCASLKFTDFCIFFFSFFFLSERLREV